MTRKILLFLCGILPVSLFALISGYEAPELQLKFLQNGPVSIGDGIYSSRNPYKKLRVVTIFGTMFPNTDEVLRFLNELQKKYEDQDLKIVAFSPEPENTIQEFLKNLTGVDKLAVAQDPNGVTAKMYLSDQTLSPRSFIINADKITAKKLMIFFFFRISIFTTLFFRLDYSITIVLIKEQFYYFFVKIKQLASKLLVIIF